MSVPRLQAVIRGDLPVTEWVLDHPTGGLVGFPARDTGWTKGGRLRVVYAPERLKVTKIGRAVRRDGSPNGHSIHATGRSGIRYWFGHVEDVPEVGAVVWKGHRLCRVSGNHEVPHLHLGIDARPLIGKSLRLGKPPVGVQIARALS